RLADGEGRHAARGAEAVALMERVDVAASALTDIKIRGAQAQEKRTALASAIARIAAQLEDHQQRQERLRRSIDEGAARAAGLRSDVEAERARLVELAGERGARGDALAQGREAHQAQQAELLHAEAELKTMRADHQQHSDATRELEFKLRDLVRERQHL